MDTVPIEKRISLAIKRVLSVLVSRLRLLLGKVLHLALHDQLGDISRQTQRLGSASVESVNYLGSELLAVNERLARIEEQLAAVREQLEASRSSESLVEEGGDVASGPRSR